VASCIVGTGKLAHFHSNLAIVEKGPLESGLQTHITEAFRHHGAHWEGLI
jgi:hypothetical protein